MPLDATRHKEEHHDRAPSVHPSPQQNRREHCGGQHQKPCPAIQELVLGHPIHSLPDLLLLHSEHPTPLLASRRPAARPSEGLCGFLSLFANLWGCTTFGERRRGELRRIPLPRTPVNKPP